MDDTMRDLLQYASKLGVELKGIAPRRLPGRGYGIVAIRDIEKGEVVLAVPTRALRTLNTVPKAVSRRLDHRDVSVHGILAAHMVLDDTGDYAAWDAVLPTPDDLEAGMPFLWPSELQALLPGPAKDALVRQQAKLQRDWESVKEAYGDKNKAASGESLPKYADYVHAWLLINSRTFYYTTPRSEAALPHHDDRIAMQPVADLFNHAADHGCRVAYDAAGFTFEADQPYAEGDEVPISYGGHANDALLVEYGFILAGGDGAGGWNRWDEVALDSAILPRLTRVQRDDLDEVGFLGRYMVDAATPGGCYRTQVALRRILSGETNRTAWQQFVDSGGAAEMNAEGGPQRDDTTQAAAGRGTRNGGVLSQERVDALLVDCLEDMAEEAHAALDAIEQLGKEHIGTESQRALLAQRWQQIETMMAQTVQELANARE